MFPFLEFGMYAEQLEQLFAYFPRTQVRIWLYEDTLSAPQLFRRQVFEFLGVDPEILSGKQRKAS